MLRYLFLTTSLFLLFISCKTAKNNTQQPVIEEPLPIIPINVSYSNLSNTDEQHFKEIIQPFYDNIIKAKLNGQFLVAKNGRILFEAYNGQEFLHKDSSKAMNEHSAIHLASVSKTFTAAAILLLQQQGKLNIDDTVTKYLPNFPYPTVTIKHLLNHRAGLPNYTHRIEDWGWKTNAMASNEDVLSLMAQSKEPQLFKTDTKFSYCNTNYAMLALIVAKVSGEPFPKFMRRHIFESLQMSDTYVFTPKDSSTSLVSYDWKLRLYPYNNLDGVYGDKNVYSTVRDLYKWDQALYTNQLLTNSTKEAAYTPYSNEKPGIKNYGLGWRMFNFPNQKKIIFHNGWWHGNNNAFVRLIQDSAVLICLGNVQSRSNYSVMQLSYLFGDYPFEYEVEEGKDTAKANELLLMQQLKLKADSLKNAKKIAPLLPPAKDTAKLRRDSLQALKAKELKLKKDTLKSIKDE